MKTVKKLLVTISTADVKDAGDNGRTLWSTLQSMSQNIEMPSFMKDITPQAIAWNAPTVLRIDWQDLRWIYSENEEKGAAYMAEESNDEGRMLWFFVRDLYEPLTGMLTIEGLCQEDVVLVEIDMSDRDKSGIDAHFA